MNTILLRSSLVIASLGAALCAHGALITIDNPNISLTKPLSGSQTYLITGTYTLDANDAPVGGGSTTFPSTSSGSTLQVAPSDAYSDAIFDGKRTFTGTLATFTVDANTPAGNYDRFGAVRLAYRVGNDPAFVEANGRFTINIAQPVPEPATMAALGFGAFALLRRRRSHS